MAVMKNVLKNKYVQAVLRGLKPCVIGIVLATGIFMIVKNALPIMPDATFSVKSFGLTIVLLALMFGSKKMLKKKISPIMLIVISAVLGAIIYAI